MAKSMGPRGPRTKSDFLNRLLSYDFTGDLRQLFPNGVTIERDGPQSVMLVDKFDPLVRFQIVVRKPRTSEQMEAYRQLVATRKEAKQKRRQRREAKQPGQSGDGAQNP